MGWGKLKTCYIVAKEGNITNNLMDPSSSPSQETKDVTMIGRLCNHLVLQSSNYKRGHPFIGSLPYLKLLIWNLLFSDLRFRDKTRKLSFQFKKILCKISKTIQKSTIIQSMDRCQMPTCYFFTAKLQYIFRVNPTWTRLRPWKTWATKTCQIIGSGLQFCLSINNIQHCCNFKIRLQNIHGSWLLWLFSSLSNIDRAIVI